MKKYKYLELIPKGWNEVKLSTYIELIKVLPADKPEEIDLEDFKLEVLEIYFYSFTGTQLSESNIKADEFQLILDRLSFLDELPSEGKTKLKIKKAERLSYQEFINFQKLAENPIDNLGSIVRLMSTEYIFEDELTVEDSFVFFCAVKKRYTKSLISFQISLAFQIIKKSLKALLKKIKFW